MNEKIISILKTFSEEDVKDFKKFIASPYFSRGRNFEKYYNSLLKFYPGFEIEKDKFLKIYFGKKDDAEGKQSKILRTLNSDFTKILEDYIAISALRRMEFYSNFLLVEGYSIRGLYEIGESKVEEYLSSENGWDVGYIKELQRILMRNTDSNFKGLANKNSEMYDVVEQQSEDLINFLFAMSNQLLNSLDVNSKVFNITRRTEQLSLLFNNFNLDKFLEDLRPDYPNYKKIKLDIIFICIMLKNKKFENLYSHLNDVYMDTYDALDMREKMNYFMSVINYYTANQSEQIIQQKFEFVKFALSKGLFPSGEIRFLNAGTFKMFLLAGLHAYDVDWTENFVKEYIEKVNPDIKENMLCYANSYIEHYKGDYLKSLDYISRFRFEMEIFTYDMKLMQLKNYYELAKQSELYIENLNYAIDAFLHFLKDNKKVSENYRLSGREFISGMRLLIKAKFGIAKKDKEEIKYDLEKFYSETRNLWLISKIKELLQLNL